MLTSILARKKITFGIQWFSFCLRWLKKVAIEFGRTSFMRYVHIWTSQTRYQYWVLFLKVLGRSNTGSVKPYLNRGDIQIEGSWRNNTSITSAHAKVAKVIVTRLRRILGWPSWPSRRPILNQESADEGWSDPWIIEPPLFIDESITIDIIYKFMTSKP